jgi:hypothetical protein
MKEVVACNHTLHATDESGLWLNGSYNVFQRDGRNVIECEACHRFFGTWPERLSLPRRPEPPKPVKKTGSTTRSRSPRIDFRTLRERVSMGEVLELLQYRPLWKSGSQLRGPCPIHGSSPNSRSLSVNLRGAFQCFKCGEKGNQLDLWMKVTNLPLREAALLLCQKLGIPPP